MTRRTTLLTAAFLAFACPARSQLEHWPKHAFALHYGRLLAAPLKAYEPFGHQHQFNTRAGNGSTIGLEYNSRTSGGIWYGAGVQMIGIGQRFDFNLVDPANSISYNGINAPAIRPGMRWLRRETPEVSLLLGKVIHSSPRWSTAAAFVAGVIPLWSTIHFKGYWWYPSGPERPLFFIETEEGLDIFPTVGFRLQLNWQARNHNRWSLLLDARTTIGNFYNGDYSLLPGTEYAGGGLLRGRLAYARLGIAYGLTWGAPRKPKWLRRQEQALPRRDAD